MEKDMGLVTARSLPRLQGIDRYQIFQACFHPAREEGETLTPPGMDHLPPRLARPLRSPFTTFFFDEK